METELTNHQDVAEPDLVGSGGAGTGQENNHERGIAEHGTRGHSREFFSGKGGKKILGRKDTAAGLPGDAATVQLQGRSRGSVDVPGKMVQSGRRWQK